jgi:uncharacterized protein (TIGR02996 family)
MHSHPDADAFMRAYLRQPEDATARLVFADWLDETGEEHNAAWAQFIRLKIEAARHPPESYEHRALNRRAGEQAPLIRAKLTIPAKLFVEHAEDLMQLLPAPSLTVRLRGFKVWQPILHLIPESVARENDLLALHFLRGRTLLIAGSDPHACDTVQKLQFILNREIVFVHGEPEDVRESINLNYGQSELQVVDSVLLDFADTVSPFVRNGPSSELAALEAPVVRLVNLIFGNAMYLRADRILLYLDLGTVGVRYRIDDEWVEGDRAPIRLLRPLVTRLATMAQIDTGRVLGSTSGSDPLVGEIALLFRNYRFRVGVTILPSLDGPTTQIDITREPAT